MHSQLLSGLEENGGMRLALLHLISGDGHAKAFLQVEPIEKKVDPASASRAGNRQSQLLVFEVLQKTQQTVNRPHLRFIMKKPLFTMAVFDELVCVQLTHKVPQDFVAFSSVQDELQLFSGDGGSHRVKKPLPSARVRRMAVYDHSIKVEDHPAKHESHLAFVIANGLARALERPGNSAAFRYQSENPVFDTPPCGQPFEARRETPDRPESGAK